MVRPATVRTARGSCRADAANYVRLPGSLGDVRAHYVCPWVLPRQKRPNE